MLCLVAGKIFINVFLNDTLARGQAQFGPLPAGLLFTYLWLLKMLSFCTTRAREDERESGALREIFNQLLNSLETSCYNVQLGTCVV